MWTAVLPEIRRVLTIQQIGEEFHIEHTNGFAHENTRRFASPSLPHRRRQKGGGSSLPVERRWGHGFLPSPFAAPAAGPLRQAVGEFPKSSWSALICSWNLGCWYLASLLSGGRFSSHGGRDWIRQHLRLQSTRTRMDVFAIFCFLGCLVQKFLGRCFPWCSYLLPCFHGGLRFWCDYISLPASRNHLIRT
jgi:hypothetical protein